MLLKESEPPAVAGGDFAVAVGFGVAVDQAGGRIRAECPNGNCNTNININNATRYRRWFRNSNGNTKSTTFYPVSKKPKGG
ncbi:MAG TPA: hypothetical protein VFQ00_12615 [Terriglobales bacterium]|nr:hypothetical protein [Terriglobales bacterium]